MHKHKQIEGKMIKSGIEDEDCCVHVTKLC